MCRIRSWEWDLQRQYSCVQQKMCVALFAVKCSAEGSLEMEKSWARRFCPLCLAHPFPICVVCSKWMHWLRPLPRLVMFFLAFVLVTHLSPRIGGPGVQTAIDRFFFVHFPTRGVAAEYEVKRRPQQRQGPLVCPRHSTVASHTDQRERIGGSPVSSCRLGRAGLSFIGGCQSNGLRSHCLPPAASTAVVGETNHADVAASVHVVNERCPGFFFLFTFSASIVAVLRGKNANWSCNRRSFFCRLAPPAPSALVVHNNWMSGPPLAVAR